MARILLRLSDRLPTRAQHLNTAGCTDGYSTSRTCEMSLSNHSGINFRGLVYLVDEATRPKAAASASASSEIGDSAGVSGETAKAAARASA